MATEALKLAQALLGISVPSRTYAIREHRYLQTLLDRIDCRKINTYRGFYPSNNQVLDLFFLNP